MDHYFFRKFLPTPKPRCFVIKLALDKTKWQNRFISMVAFESFQYSLKPFYVLEDKFATNA